MEKLLYDSLASEKNLSYGNWNSAVEGLLSASIVLNEDEITDDAGAITAAAIDASAPLQKHVNMIKRRAYSDHIWPALLMYDISVRRAYFTKSEDVDPSVWNPTLWDQGCRAANLSTQRIDALAELKSTDMYDFASRGDSVEQSQRLFNQVTKFSYQSTHKRPYSQMTAYETGA